MRSSRVKENIKEENENWKEEYLEERKKEEEEACES